jgi:hypothetical protein
MGAQEFRRGFEAAMRQRDDEASRTRGGFQPAPPQTPAANTAAGPGTEQPLQPVSSGDAQPLRSAAGPDPAFTGAQQHLLPPPPVGQPGYADQIRAMFPMLAHLPDIMLVGQPLDAIYRLAREEKAAEGKVAKNLEQRAHNNALKAAANPAEVKQGLDNRGTILHPARFLAGAAVPLQRLWHEARAVWGQDGVDTITGYDMRSLGHAGCITARGWDALHHPGSTDISLKLFSISNVGRAATGLKAVNAVSEDGFIVADSLKELGDMAEVRSALQNLCLAAQLAAPWNMSFAVLDAFLKATTNLESDLTNLKKAPIVSAFIDHVLQVNAANWLNDVDFLDMPGLKALWEAWWCARKGSWKAEAATGQANQAGQQQGGGANANRQAGGNGGQGDSASKRGGKKGFFNRRGGGGGGQQYANNGGGNNGGQYAGGQYGQYQAFGGRDGMAQPTLYATAPSEKNLCRKYNDGGCPNHHARCSFMGKFGPMKLYHLCNFLKRENNEQKLCMERHARSEFHKTN